MPAPTPNDSARDTTLQPADSLSDASARQLDELEQDNRLRSLRAVQPQGRTINVDGRELLNLASNDYLALSQHPKLVQAAVNATQRYGVGSGASRLVSGTQPLHEEVEQRFASFKHAEAALLLPTGYTANLSVLTTLAGPDDLIVMDKLVHASLIDAARASDATVRTFPHLQLDRAEQLLTRHTIGRHFLVTDSVFSMDGDCADLPALCDLADRTQASLIVDEAHGTGVLGNDGSGLASAQAATKRIYTCGNGGVVISTASKALGSLGGLITAAKPVIDLIVNRARPFIYSTAVPPAQAAAIIAALDVIQEEPTRREQLAAISSQLRNQLQQNRWKIDEQSIATPILPLIVGSESDALGLSQLLKEKGFYAPAIRPPTVAPGHSRVRLSLRADLQDRDIDHLLEAIGRPKT